MKRQDKYPDTSSFRYYNANPKGKLTDDCVIRAISTAMDRPYEEVYRELFEMSIKTGYMLNSPELYSKYLKAKGWIKHPQPRHGDRSKYTGKEFCRMVMWGKSEAGERIVAHIGGHHLVAIMDGKVMDTWDSTDGCIGNYWTLRL